MKRLDQLEILRYALRGARDRMSYMTTREQENELACHIDELEKRIALARERRKENECQLSI